MFVSPRLTNEEIYLAQKLARAGLRTHNVTSFAHLANKGALEPRRRGDRQLPRSGRRAGHPGRQRESRPGAFRRRPGRQARDPGGRQAHLHRAGHEPHRAVCGDLSWSASRGRRAPWCWACSPSTAGPRRARTDVPAGVAAAMAGLTPEEVERRTGARCAGRSARPRGCWRQSTLKVMVFNRDFRGTRQAGDSRLLAAVAPALGCGLLPLHEKANMQGLLDMGADPRWYPGYQPVATSAVIDEFEKAWGVALRDCRAGGSRRREAAGREEDQGRAGPRRGPAGVRVAALGDQRRAAGDRVPRRGRPVPHRHRSSRPRRVAVLQRRGDVRAPSRTPSAASSRSAARFRRGRASRPGTSSASSPRGWAAPTRRSYGNPGEVFDEIRRVTPIHRDLVVDSQEPDSIWDPGRIDLPAIDSRLPGRRPCVRADHDAVRWTTSKGALPAGSKGCSLRLREKGPETV